jgi:hypothetical protein
MNTIPSAEKIVYCYRSGAAVPASGTAALLISTETSPHQPAAFRFYLIDN